MLVRRIPCISAVSRGLSDHTEFFIEAKRLCEIEIPRYWAACPSLRFRQARCCIFKYALCGLERLGNTSFADGTETLDHLGLVEQSIKGEIIRSKQSRDITICYLFRIQGQADHLSLYYYLVTYLYTGFLPRNPSASTPLPGLLLGAPIARKTLAQASLIQPFA